MVQFTIFFTKPKVAKLFFFYIIKFSLILKKERLKYYKNMRYKKNVCLYNFYESFTSKYYLLFIVHYFHSDICQIEKNTYYMLRN